MTTPEDAQALVKRLELYAAGGHASTTHAYTDGMSLVRDAADALATALRERDTLAAQWQPIETAPYMVLLLLFFPKLGTDVDMCMVGARHHDTPDYWFAPDWGYSAVPTHWMPLPDPPRALQPTPPETPEP